VLPTENTASFGHESAVYINKKTGNITSLEEVSACLTHRKVCVLESEIYYNFPVTQEFTSRFGGKPLLRMLRYFRGLFWEAYEGTEGEALTDDFPELTSSRCPSFFVSGKMVRTFPTTRINFRYWDNTQDHAASLFNDPAESLDKWYNSLIAIPCYLR
jgi:hypothetical protein